VVFLFVIPAFLFVIPAKAGIQENLGKPLLQQGTYARNAPHGV